MSLPRDSLYSMPERKAPKTAPVSASGGIPMKIPNLRDRIQRDIWRNDVACTDPKVAGNQLLPCLSSGDPGIPDEVYARQKALWEEELAERRKAEEKK